METLRLLEENGTPVTPRINVELVDKSNLMGGAIVRYEGHERVAVPGFKPWTKYTFTLPGGGHFALGGDRALSSLLARCKPNDLIGLRYGGLTTADVPEHQWQLYMITATGDQLRAVIHAFDVVYTALREAVAHAEQKRRSRRSRGPGPSADRDFSDDEAPR